MKDWLQNIAIPTRGRAGRDEIAARLLAVADAGFRFSYDTDKLTLFQTGDLSRDVYVDKTTKSLKVIVHPNLKSIASEAAEGRGRLINSLYHNSNMRRFPERKHTGKKPTRCGIAIQFDGVDQLKAFATRFAETI
jgi:hypothetical protein